MCRLGGITDLQDALQDDVQRQDDSLQKSDTLRHEWRHFLILLICVVSQCCDLFWSIIRASR